MTTPRESYDAITKGADANDRRRFNDYLVGYLLATADPQVCHAALEAATADVNGVTA